MPVLETERLLLRPFEADDVDDLAALFGDAEVMRYLGGAPMTREEAWRHLALVLGHERLRGYTFHAVIDKTTGAFAGRCGLWRPEGWPGVEVGWALARQHWHRGFATESALAWRDWAFRELPRPEPPYLYSLIAPGNVRSAAVAQRIGHHRLESWTERGMACELWGQPWP